MCEKTTNMYKLVRHQSSMESSHIMKRVGGRDCSGLLAWRKKEFRGKIFIIYLYVGHMYKPFWTKKI